MKKFILSTYFIVRLPFLWAIKILFRSPSSQPENLSKFLIIRLDRMGDFILSIPVIENIRIKYPGARIDVLVRPYLKELAGLVKSIDNIIIYDSFFAVVGKIRQEKYDAVFDPLFDYKIKPALLAYLSQAPIRVGLAWGYRELFFNYKLDPFKYPDTDMVGIHLKLLGTLNIPDLITIPKLDIKIQEAYGDLTIVMHPIGYYQSQRWDADKFILLAKKILGNYGVKIKVIGSPGDKIIINNIIRGINDPRAVAVLGGMRDVAFILSKSCLLVCNHSGPLHLAAALGIPTVSIMGPADPTLWWPKGENNIVVRKDLKCSPCSKGRCLQHKCMDLVSVDEIFDKVKIVMSKQKK